MLSCEPNRTVPYSSDLRWRMVHQVEIQGKSYREVGENLGVDSSVPNVPLSIANWALKVREGVEIELRSSNSYLYLQNNEIRKLP